MPLPPPAPRKLAHVRTIVCAGYERADGQFEVDGHLRDVKTEDIPDWGGGEIPAGKPIHDMRLRMTVDDGLTVTDSVAAMDDFPWRVCPSVAPAFGALKGLSLKPGFTKKVSDVLGGIKGCTHLGSLIGPVATTMMQTMIRSRLKKAEDNKATSGPRKAPPFINTCHTWARTSPVVQREFPDLYIAPERTPDP